ncbi:Uncharacterized protein PECH_002066 [Penicillium ucsense]|uniref:Peroxisomal membrane protein PEX14 n=1 Tax=Penicillium ucsense TaxID=2839758 RepID=A0A8J8W4Y8_9EURO|nr:Uncharacterized protein PECM_002629 [Penicillium ucsense]KAF7738028.1 Uncharacterized protein PECH_002066 [Penicillium ucsense]
MSDPESKSPAIPAWQKQSGSEPAEQSPLSSSPNSEETPAAGARQELLDQASKFLEDDSIRDAPTDRKINFLESKGLTSAEIQQVLGVSRNLDGSDSTGADPQPGAQAPTSSPSPTSQSEISSISTPTSTQTAVASTAPPSIARDVPPIITYPEFLFQPAKPPPLVTMSRVLYTIYGAAGLGASIYGASEYLFKPMLKNLTEARLDLSNTAKKNLQKLNEKLEQTVSVVPAHLKVQTLLGQQDMDDNDSIASDPTELFHRDMGTQTTPDVSSGSISPSVKDTADGAANPATLAVNKHISRLESIQSSLKEINKFDGESGSLEDSMRARLTDLSHYLDGLIYAGPTYTTSPGFGGLYSGHTGNTSSGSSGVRKSEEDAIAAFKTEIRGVKGALLSARNFPASRGGRVGTALSVGGRS